MKGVVNSEGGSNFQLITKTNLTSGPYNCLKWQFQKMDMFVGLTSIVVKMKHPVQIMHKLWTLSVVKQQEPLLTY